MVLSLLAGHMVDRFSSVGHAGYSHATKQNRCVVEIKMKAKFKGGCFFQVVKGLLAGSTVHFGQ